MRDIRTGLDGVAYALLGRTVYFRKEHDRLAKVYPVFGSIGQESTIVVNCLFIGCVAKSI
jgi:hypothetical protein